MQRSIRTATANEDKIMTIYKLKHISVEECEKIVRDKRGSRLGDKYENAFTFFREAYCDLIIRDLRINTKTWIMRDNGYGVLQRPSQLEEWPVCTEEDARYELAWKVWCTAVRLYNLEHM